MYKNVEGRIRLDKIGPNFKIECGIKQGDPLSPTSFNSLIKEVFQKLKWEGKGIKIDDEWFNNLRFADDITLISQDRKEVENMANELVEQCHKVGLSINANKTILLSNAKLCQEIKIGNEIIKMESSTIYLGQIVSFKDNVEKELARRRTQAWKSFWALKKIYKSKKPQEIKKKIYEIYESCTIPVLLYGSQTWATTQNQNTKLIRTQIAMERTMSGVKRRDRLSNKQVRGKHKFEIVGIG